MKFFISITFILFSLSYCYANNNPQIFLFLDGGKAEDYAQYLQNPHIQGAQIIYSWKQLEPEKDKYDFDQINADYHYLSSIHKKLFIQIQDRSFDPNVIPVPTYLLKDKIYQGGVAEQYDFPGENKAIAEGWVAEQWVPTVKTRFQLLLQALGNQFNGKIYGINLAETSIDLQNQHFQGFTCDKYFNAVLENMRILKSAFQQSAVVQYVNFFPCEWNNDHNYMSRLFKYAVKNHIGLGNPNTVPYRKGQMKNSYSFFNQYKNQLSVIAFAVQEPDYSYIDPTSNKPFTMQEIAEFAKSYLGAKIIFWNVQEPEFSDQFLPLLNTNKLFVSS